MTVEDRNKLMDKLAEFNHNIKEAEASIRKIMKNRKSHVGFKSRKIREACDVIDDALFHIPKIRQVLNEDNLS